MPEKELDLKNKKKINGENPEVSTGDSDIGESVPDEVVETAKDEADQTVDDNVELAEENVNADMNSETESAPGEEKKEKKKVKDYFGSSSVIEGQPSGMSLMSRNFMFAGEEAPVINDIDAFERNSDKAQREFNRVESKILREATQSVVDGESSVNIKGTPANNTIYPTESEITTETVSGKNAAAAHSFPRMRENGTMFMSGINVPVFANTIIHSNAGGQDSQHTLKNLHKDVVLFNNIDAQGNIREGFRHVRRGIYIVKGINPIMTKAAGFTGSVNNTEKVIGYVKRDNISGSDSYIPVMESTHELFRVQDLTPTLSDITNAAEDLVNEVVANESRMRYGAFEQIQVEMSRIREAFDDVNNTLNYPEFADEDRSTLTKMEPAIFSINGNDASLYNNYKSYAALMNEFAQSESLFALPRLNVHNIKDNLKTFRGLEGKDPEYFYFKEVFKGDPNDTNYTTPTMADFASSKGSPRTHDNLAKWIYGFPQFWRSLKEALDTFDNSKLKNELLSKVKVSEEAFNDLVDSISIGRFSDNDGVTSAEVLKLQDENAFAIGFNPNDLVGYGLDSSVNRIYHSDGSTELLKPYIVTGYLNVRTRETQVGSSARYYVAPTWLQTLVKVFSNELHLQTHLTRNKKEHAILDYFADWNNYLPWKLDLKKTTWLDMFILEGMMLTDSDVLDFDLPRNGFIRFLTYLEEASLLDKFYGEKSVSVSDLIDRIVNNDVLWLKPFMNTPADFPVIIDSAKEKYDSEPFENQIAVLGKARDGSDSTTKTFVIMQPSRLDTELYSLTDLEFRNVPAFAESKVDIIEDISVLAHSINGSDSTQNIFRTMPTGKFGEFILLWRASAGGGAQANLVTLRKILNPDLSTAKRFVQLTEGADPSILGWNTAPDKALFGKDGFQYIDPSEAYTIVIQKGIQANGKIDERPFTWKFSLAPVYISLDNEWKTANTAVANYKQMPLIYMDVTGNNQLLDNAGEVGSQTYSRYRGLDTNNATAINEIIAVSRSAVPSMYGHRRKIYRGLLDHTLDSSGKPINGYQGNDAGYAIKAANNAVANLHAELPATAYGLFSRHFYSFFPKTDYGAGALHVTRTNINAMSLTDLKDMFTAMNLEPGDPLYYDRQETVIYNFPYVRPGASNLISSLDALLAKHGFYANLNTLVDYLDYLPDSEENAQSDDISSNLPIKLITPILPNITLDSYYALQDFIRKHFFNYYTIPIPSRLFLLGRRDAGFMSFDDPGLIGTKTHDAFVNSVMHSRFYINDFRDYVYQRPIKSLNYRWYGSQISKSAFADQFYNQVD